MSTIVKIAKKIDNIGLFQEKSKQGSWGYLFLKNRLEFIDLSLYPKKFQRKQAFTPGNSSKLCEG